MNKRNIFKQLLSKVPESKRRYVDKQLQVAGQISHLLKEQGWKKSEFAKQVGIHPSQLTNALSGEANLTLEFIARLEAGFHADIIRIPLYAVASKPFLEVANDWIPVPSREQMTAPIMDTINDMGGIATLIHGSSLPYPKQNIKSFTILSKLQHAEAA